MGIKISNNIRIINKTNIQNSIEDSLDDDLEVFFPDWLLVDFTNFERYPEKFNEYLSFGKQLYKKGISYKKNQKPKEKNGLPYYVIPTRVSKKISALNVLNKDYRSGQAQKILDDKDSPKEIVTKGNEKTTNLVLRNCIGGQSNQVHQLFMDVSLDVKNNNLYIHSMTKEGDLFLNTLIFLLGIKEEKGGNLF